MTAPAISTHSYTWRAVPPMTAVTDPAALKMVAGEIGRYDLCGLETTAWAGGGVRLGEACFRREMRRRVWEDERLVRPAGIPPLPL